ncbi:MAG: hypothetical protein BHV69_01815 [Bacteroidales bacterium 52_46]|nr:MAG: hypothetical protein BHV69_01815 [Bacteroidales bacterium 52_46]
MDIKKLISATTMSLFCSFGALAYGGFIDRGPTTGWADLGDGEYYDGLVCDVFPGLVAGEHWKVRVQHNPSNPGWYRFQPFDGDWPGVDIAGESQVYMIINASNPEKAYMCDTDKILVDASGWQYIFSQEVPENYGDASIYGTLKNGVVEFPANSFTLYKCSPADSWDRTQTKVVNCAGKLKVVLPEAAGVGQITVGADAGAAVYFDLQGRKVENPSCGIFIKKTQAGAERVIIK